MTEVIALIPARSGSKGVKDKNIKKLGGQRLLDWSIAACLKSSIIGRTIVSTDSALYANIARSNGAECPFLRPKDISDDRSTDLEFVKHAISWLRSFDHCPTLIVHIRPTTPFRNPKIIDNAIRKFQESTSATSLRSVHEMSESAYKCFQIGDDQVLETIFYGDRNLDMSNNARQTFNKTYSANGYVDVLSVDKIIQTNLLHGNHVLPFVTEHVTEIDTLREFELLECELANNMKIKTNLFG